MDGAQNNSKHSRLNKVLDIVSGEIKEFAMDQYDRIHRLTQIGIALSSEKDVNKLLEMILDEAMRLPTQTLAHSIQWMKVATPFVLKSLKIYQWIPIWAAPAGWKSIGRRLS